MQRDAKNKALVKQVYLPPIYTHIRKKLVTARLRKRILHTNPSITKAPILHASYTAHDSYTAPSKGLYMNHEEAQ
jgi:hypothetical protein